MRLFTLALFLIFAFSCNVAAWTSQKTYTDGKSLFSAVIKTYSDAKSIAVTGEKTIVTKADGRKVSEEKIDYTIRLARPNKAYMDSGDRILVSNGKSFWSYSSDRKQYTKTDVPSDILKKVATLEPGVNVLNLFAKIDFTDQKLSYSLKNNEKLHGSEVYVLRITAPKDMGDITQDLYINRSFLTIVKSKTSVKVRPPKESGADTPSIIETIVTDTFKKASLNSTFDKKAFIFSPPAGATAVETKGPVNLKGKSAPDFSYTRIDGSSGSISKSKGKPVVLSFLSLKKSPKLLGALTKLHKKGVVEVVAVSTYSLGQPDREKEMESYLKAKGYGLPVVHINSDILKTAFNTYGVKNFPTTFIIDKSGVVRFIDESDLSYESLNNKLASLSK